VGAVTTNVDLTDRVLARREVDRVLDGESEAARVTPSPEEPQYALLTLSSRRGCSIAPPQRA